jgi:hypothetical protein
MIPRVITVVLVVVDVELHLFAVVFQWGNVDNYILVGEPFFSRRFSRLS